MTNQNLKIGFFELEGWEDKVVIDALGKEIYLSKKKITSDDLPVQDDFEIISIFVDSRIDEEVLTHLPKLKFLTTRSTGYDHIDLVACKKRKITIAYVPGYGDNTVAEFTFGLILNLTRKIYQAIDQIKEITSFSLKSLRGIDLKEKTIGVIGTGRIGKEVIKIANGFGMKVVAYDPFPNPELAKTMGFKYVTLEDLLKDSHIITIHCPYCKETKHLIHKGNINLIKRGAYLINTARGGIVETGALIQALQNGILAGAGLDVLEEEGETKDEIHFLRASSLKTEELKTLLQNHILMRMPNVLITPHNAFNSQEALERILDTTIKNIKGFIKGKPVNTI